MISSAFKSAYLNEQSAINETASNVTSAIKDSGTLVAGIAGFSGELGSGAVATAAKHNLAGRIGGIGGNIMLYTMDEKVESAKNKNNLSMKPEEITSTIHSQLEDNPINRAAIKKLDTVFNTIMKAKEEKIINNQGKIVSNIGNIDPNSEIGKKILEQLGSKQKQMDIINETNPMRDNYHTGIRNVNDIKTWDEAIEDEESFTYGDFSKEDAIKAKETGKITVYSSKPISAGGFVSTSKNMAQDYAGKGKVYEQIVNLEDVAWINGDEGQYTRRENK